MSHAKLQPTLDPADVVVIFADLQPELAHKSRSQPGEAIEAAAETLAKAAAIFDWPTLFSTVGVDGELPNHLSLLKPFVSEADAFVRATARPFGDPAFVEALSATGRKTLVVAGYSCEAVVQYLALDGLANGYHVVVAVEACGSRSRRTEKVALARIAAAGAIVTSVADILQSAEPNLTGERGEQVFGLVHDFMGKDF